MDQTAIAESNGGRFIDPNQTSASFFRNNSATRSLRDELSVAQESARLFGFRDDVENRSGALHTPAPLKGASPMPVCRLTARVLGPAVACIAVSMLSSGLAASGEALMIVSAQAQSKQQDPLEQARTAVETLINRLRGRDMPEGIVKSNGRIEATQVDVAAKYPGRLATLTVDEGDEVTAGQVVATISSPETEAQLRAAQAQVLKAKQALASAVALVSQRKSDLDFTRTDYDRGKMLIEHGNIPQQMLDQRRNKFEAAEAGFVSANAQRDEADAAIKAAEADVERLQSILADLVLVSPRSGRVQYRLARAGEVVAAGQRVLTILDLNDVYMTIYLPADQAGQLTLGDEARVIADPIPQYVIPATISFVATDAQFTPKSVETAEERQKLMFRVKLQGDPQVLSKYHRQVKTGVRGLGFVRTDPKIVWPDELAVKLPP
jgi:HlyD family secretion protein